jgi:hypothetical protein
LAGLLCFREPRAASGAGLRRLVGRVGSKLLVGAFWERWWFGLLMASFFCLNPYLPLALLTLLRELELGRMCYDISRGLAWNSIVAERA